MSHFKLHPILFCALFYQNKICLNPHTHSDNFKHILFRYKVHRKGLGEAYSATLPSPILDTSISY